MKKLRLTQKEYDMLKKEFDTLFARQGKFREAYIRSVEEGDERENDGWYVTHDLNEQNIHRLTELKKIIDNSKIVAENHKDEKITLGDKVVLKINDGAPTEYQLSGFVGAQKHIAVVSTESPIGKAIFGKHIGQITESKIAGKKVKIEIVSVA